MNANNHENAQFYQHEVIQSVSQAEPEQHRPKLYHHRKGAFCNSLGQELL